MYAIVVDVTIDPSRKDEAERLLHEDVVPSVKQAPGLVAAYWLRSEDGTKGQSVIVFEDKRAAQNAIDLNPPAPPPDAPVQLGNVEVHEVLAHV